MSEETPSERIRRKIREGREPASRDIKRLHEERIKRKPEDLERKAEEARKEEQHYKEELRLMKEETERRLLRTIAQQIEDELGGQAAYTTIANFLDILGLNVTSKEVRTFIEDERKHQRALEILFQTIAKKPFKVPKRFEPWSLEELRRR